MAEADTLHGLELTGLHKAFGPVVALDGVTFAVKPGEVAALLGPSGCGKSTTLNLIAGFEPPDAGTIAWDAADLAEVPPHERRFGLMFQDFALFPHMSVGGNVAFGLRMLGRTSEQVAAGVRAALDLVGLEGFEDRAVDTLSGGERQRVALARTLAPEPRLVMLDEPLGALDRTLKEHLMLELPDLLRRLGQTVIYVTHDQEEAFAIAERVIVMNHGRVAQIGAPEALYAQPADAFVARFLGLDNLLEGQVVSRSDGPRVVTALGDFPAPDGARGTVHVLIRPEVARLDGGGDLVIEGRLAERSFRGSVLRAILVHPSGVRLTFDFHPRAKLPPVDDTLRVGLDSAEAVQVLT